MNQTLPYRMRRAPRHARASTWLLAGLVVVAVVAGIWAGLGINASADRGSGLPDAFNYDIAAFAKTDPALVLYEEAPRLPIHSMQTLRGLSVGPDGEYAVVGDRQLAILSREGKSLTSAELESEPQSVAIAGSAHSRQNRIYVGLGDRVVVFDETRSGIEDSALTRLTPAAHWPPTGKKSVLTSIAVSENDVFVADAGEKVVWRYDADGKLLGEIGRRDADRNIDGFSIPSPYFDCAVGPDGLLHVVNPAYHRIEAYTFDGHLELQWGKPGMHIENFCGCCNPAHIAIFRDGRIVTSEKGLLRVKLYDAAGKFLGVVAGTESLAPGGVASLDETREDVRVHPLDVAVGKEDEILLLDPQTRTIRRFHPKSSKPSAAPVEEAAHS